MNTVGSTGRLSRKRNRDTSKRSAIRLDQDNSETKSTTISSELPQTQAFTTGIAELSPSSLFKITPVEVSDVANKETKTETHIIHHVSQEASQILLFIHDPSNYLAEVVNDNDSVDVNNEAEICKNHEIQESYPVPVCQLHLPIIDLQLVVMPHAFFDFYFNEDSTSQFTYVKRVVQDQRMWLPNLEFQEELFEQLRHGCHEWTEYKIIPNNDSSGICDTIHIKENQRLKTTYKMANARDIDYLLGTHESSLQMSLLPSAAHSFISTMSDRSENVVLDYVFKSLNLEMYKLVRGPLALFCPNLAGISTPLYHFSTKGSVIPMHVTEGLLCSVQLLLSGRVEWLIIHPEDSNTLRQAARTYLRESKTEKSKDNNKRNGSTLSFMKPASAECVDPMAHGNIWFTRSQLQKLGIRYKVVILEAGQVIYIGSGIYYQVLNVESSIHVSLASMSLEWVKRDDLNMQYNTQVCRCRKESLFPPAKIALLKHGYLHCPQLPSACLSTDYLLQHVRKTEFDRTEQMKLQRKRDAERHPKNDRKSTIITDSASNEKSFSTYQKAANKRKKFIEASDVEVILAEPVSGRQKHKTDDSSNDSDDFVQTPRTIPK